MNLTTTDTKPMPIAVDKDSHKIAIIYGNLGTLIAFASLVFAVLGYMSSRRRRVASQRGAPAPQDIELGVNTPQRFNPSPPQPQDSANISHEYSNDD